MNNISIYIHYPFCRSKCNYCDFNSYCFNVDDDILIDSYLKELDFYKDIMNNRQIDTIYFGGGTPSLMSTKLLESILKKINCFKMSKNCEISSEINPNSINYEKMKNFNSIGINRISIGVQSLNNERLKFLGRIHSVDEALKTIKDAEKIFKSHYSIDLIYGEQTQQLDNWKNELEDTTKLSPYHISVYNLIVENGTFFSRHKIKKNDEYLEIKFYETTQSILEKNNLNFYEISNFAKNGFECRHNLNYWNNGEWIGIGAGAHGRININNNRYAVQNIKNPLKWVKKVKQNNNGISIKTKLNKDDIKNEKILMGLRTLNGIDIENLKLNNIDVLLKEKLIKIKNNNLSLTKNGFLLLNSIIEKLI